MRYFIEGKVIPERVDFNLPSVELEIGDDENKIRATLAIVKSKIFMHVDLNHDLLLADIRNRIFTVLGSVINFAGFFYVLGISYEIDSITNLDTRSTVVFGVEGYVFENVSEFGDRLTFVSQACDSPLPLIPQFLTNPHIARATFELRNSIRYPDFTALHCRLAIEAIRNAFNSSDENAGWNDLRTNLNLDRNTIQSFKDIATAQRHGRNEPQSWEQRRRCMQIAWEIVYRYTRFLQADGKSPLDCAKL
ncbi:MAG: hypothetical protein WBP94_11235 [Rhodomicrobiaceae bacterium]